MNRTLWMMMLLVALGACGPTSCPVPTGLPGDTVSAPSPGEPPIAATTATAPADPAIAITDLAHGRFAGLALGDSIDSCIAACGEPEDQLGQVGDRTFTYAYYAQGLSVSFSSQDRRVICIAVHGKPNALLAGSERFKARASPISQEDLASYPNAQYGAIYRYSLSVGHIDVLYSPDQRFIWLIALVAPSAEIAPALAALAGPVVTSTSSPSISSAMTADLPPLPADPTAYANRLLLRIPNLPLVCDGRQNVAYPTQGRIVADGQRACGRIRVVFEIQRILPFRPTPMLFSLVARTPKGSDLIRSGLTAGGELSFQATMNIAGRDDQCIQTRTSFLPRRRYTVDFIWGRQGIAIYVDRRLEAQSRIDFEHLFLETPTANSSPSGGQGLFIGQENLGADYHALRGVTIHNFEIFGPPS